MSLKFCGECGQPLRATNDTLYICPNGHETFNNPRACVAIIFWRDGQALFSKRGIEPGKGKYDFPGGFCNYNEPAVAAAQREILEETGIQLAANQLQLITTYTGEYFPGLSTTDVMFLVTDWQGDFQPHDDSEALEWRPITFVDDPQSNVAGLYPGLAAKVQALLERAV